MDTVELLEPGIAKLAAAYRMDEDLEEMDAAIDRMQQATDKDEFIGSNVEWHVAMAKAKRNPILVAIYQPIVPSPLHPALLGLLTVHIASNLHL